MAKSKAAAPLLGHGDLGTSLLFVFPLFLLYGVGVMFAPSMNGVDFVSRNLFAAVGHDRKLYLLVHVGMAVGFLAVLAVLRSKKLFDARRFPPMLLEAGIYALTLGTLILFVMHRILGIEPKLSMGLGTSIVLSIGAGVYEELVFRLGCFSGGAALARLFGLSNRAALVIAALVSSVLFSAAHHVGAAGEPWAFDVFVYRSLAGLVFAAIYWYRSLGHAVYTHALYDIYVMVLR
jgi:Type II CAAX prenyl endopeptidase Rce1-like